MPPDEQAWPSLYAECQLSVNLDVWVGAVKRYRFGVRFRDKATGCDYLHSLRAAEHKVVILFEFKLGMYYGARWYGSFPDAYMLLEMAVEEIQ